MATTTTFTKTGSKATSPTKLDKTIFDTEVKNHDLVKAAYVAYLANGRGNLAVTKTRGLISGGGKKPWAQKGTGRARFGSSRNPIWRGGGIVFGPTGLENYTHKMHTTAKRKAISQALTLANQSDKIIIVEDFDAKTNKTSKANDFFTKIGANRKILLVVADKTENVLRSTNNLPNVIVVQPKYLNVYDIMNANHIVVTSASLPLISEWLGVKK